jgi:hypothetical protein
MSLAACTLPDSIDARGTPRTERDGAAQKFVVKVVGGLYLAEGESAGGSSPTARAAW